VNSVHAANQQVQLELTTQAPPHPTWRLRVDSSRLSSASRASPTALSRRAASSSSLSWRTCRQQQQQQ
jgi:hypothetical protein